MIISGLCTELGEIKAEIILSGDPNQLNAVTKSLYATKFGYGKSFMEYLSDLPCYKQNHDVFIVQLTKNYRNHPAILRMPSKLFYGDSLENKAAKGI